VAFAIGTVRLSLNTSMEDSGQQTSSVKVAPTHTLYGDKQKQKKEVQKLNQSGDPLETKQHRYEY